MCASGFALNWSARFKNSLTTVEGAEKQMKVWKMKALVLENRSIIISKVSNVLGSYLGELRAFVMTV